MNILAGSLSFPRTLEERIVCWFVGNMDAFPDVLCGWSWEENKLFEVALAVVDEGDPDRWQVVAAMVGGKSAEEVEKHYVVLLQDLHFIESGRLDHKLAEAQAFLQLDCTESVYWTDEDNHKLLFQLDIN